MVDISDLVSRSSVNRALNAIGDRWSQLIIQEAFRGARRFEQFRSSCNAPRNTLTVRLRRLLENGLLEKGTAGSDSSSRDYLLTDKGRELFDSILIAWSWSVRWDAAAPGQTPSLIHLDCGKSMLPVPVCSHCDGEISLHACRHELSPVTDFDEIGSMRLHRRRQTDEQVGRGSIDVNDIIGDRWTAMVISSQYFGVHRFDEIQSLLKISTNILTDRLRALIAFGILERRLYELSPARYDYWLTKKGRDLYPHALSLLLWADKWLLGGRSPSVKVYHRYCGHEVSMKLVCGECNGVLTPDNVTERHSRYL